MLSSSNLSSSLQNNFPSLTFIHPGSVGLGDSGLLPPSVMKAQWETLGPVILSSLSLSHAVPSGNKIKEDPHTNKSPYSATVGGQIFIVYRPGFRLQVILFKIC